MKPVGRRQKAGGRKYGLTVFRAIPIFGSAIGLGVSIALLLTLNVAGRAHNDRIERANRVIAAWNDMAHSMDGENALLSQLQENLKANPPHLVNDVRRRELYKEAIAAHEKQLADFRVMEENDK